MLTHPSGQTEECFDPWGKPGSGAPLRNTEGQTMAALYGKCYREQQGTREPLAEAIHQSQEAKEQEARKTLKGGCAMADLHYSEILN